MDLWVLWMIFHNPLGLIAIFVILVFLVWLGSRFSGGDNG